MGGGGGGGGGGQEVMVELVLLTWNRLEAYGLCGVSQLYCIELLTQTICF